MLGSAVLRGHRLPDCQRLGLAPRSGPAKYWRREKSTRVYGVVFRDAVNRRFEQTTSIAIGLLVTLAYAALLWQQMATLKPRLTVSCRIQSVILPRPYAKITGRRDGHADMTYPESHLL